MAFKYGIKVVYPGGVGRDEVIGFSPQGYKTWKTTVGIGTRMLLYETASSELNLDAVGRMAIFGEVEVVSDFYKDELTAPSPLHPWLVRVSPIRFFPDVPLIPASTMRNVIGDRNFPQKGDTWRELSEKQYAALIAHFEKPDRG